MPFVRFLANVLPTDDKTADYFKKMIEGMEKSLAMLATLATLKSPVIQAPFCSRGVTEKWNETAGLVFPIFGSGSLRLER